MNVVGKVGSLISQGVYSVATPFHPFGGAVDIIVVQQQDGTFRSTPWYVRFGKFQGVLKGAEKIVRISVNGVEADFHMYLDNSGEAYFIREVDPDKESQTDEFSKESNTSGVPTQNESNNEERHNHYVDNFRLEHTVSDSGAMHLSVSSVVGHLERAESDGDRRFYDFQDEPPSQEDSISLSEYGSCRYENMDGENFTESQNSNSEVVLVSVDGHVLTAPLSASEKNAGNVQLDTPQFHLGPGEGAEFCEGSEDFTSGENTWAADDMGKLKASTANVVSDNLDTVNDEPKDFSNDHRVCEGDGEHVCEEGSTQIVLEQEIDINVQNESLDTLEMNRKEEVFKSCLELSDLAALDMTLDSDNIVSPSDIQSKEKLAAQDVTVDSDSVVSPSDIQSKEKLAAQDVTIDSDYVVSASDNLGKEKLLGSFPPVDENDGGQGVEMRSSDEDSHSHVVNGTCENPDIRHEPDSKDNLETEHGGSISKSDRCYNFLEPENEQVGTSEAVENDNEKCQSEDGHDEIVTAEEQSAALSEEAETHSKSRFEISLCRHELHAGMGLAAAAEAFDAHYVSAEEFLNSITSTVTNENLVVRYAERYLTWEKAAPIILGASVFALDLPVESIETIPVEQEETVKPVENDTVATPTSGSRRWRLWPIPFRRVKTIQHENSTSSSEDVFVDSESSSQHSPAGLATSAQHEKSPHKQLVRTNVPTNEQIASLNLQDGQNMITFSFSTRVLGKQQVDAHIYLWKWNARIVISDVDGTITKSDVLGQFMPLVGKDWTQSGVARLFSAIKENGYQLLFLSARAIVQAYLTRSFLLNLKQDGKALPSGPVVISPDGLFPSLYREVIRRAPHEFKIACLEDIKALFPSDYNPFYAGFGNRDTDEVSYRKIGIPKGKIFIINPKGEVAISHRIDVKSYTSLHTLANDMFPPTSLIEQEDFNSWNYWRTPLPEIEDI